MHSWSARSSNMWARLAFCVLVIAVANAEHRAWQVGKQYDYQIRGRTLAALHDVANKYNGILVKATVRIQPEDDDTLNARIVNAVQAEIDQHLSGGWGSPVDDAYLSYQPMKLSNEPFQIKMHNGVVRKLVVSSKLATSEVNFIKGLVSQLQVDSKGENMRWEAQDELPSEVHPNGVYSVMEDTVTGKCQVQYDVSELPKYIAQSRSEMVPMPELVKDSHFIDIVKSTNYSRCVNRPEYHFGLNGRKWKPASNKMGRFFARSSVSRIIVSGNVNKYTIQSSVSSHKAIISPALYNSQKGMVVSRINMTLSKVENASDIPQPPTNPITHKTLVYKFQPEAYKQGERARQTRNAGAGAGVGPEEESSSVEVTFEVPPVNLSHTEERKKGENDSVEELEALPELDESIDMLLHPLYFGTEKMETQKVHSYITEYAKQIGQEVQNANEIPSKATLAKWTILATLIRSAKPAELKRITKELYVKSEGAEQKPAEAAAWKAFRDAVAEAGTGPALLALRDWIMTDLVKEQEAAELLATLPRSARVPSNKYLNAFFELAISQKVKQQHYLNATAILSFADLVRLAQVDRESMHNRYPAHILARLSCLSCLSSQQDNQGIARDYLPYVKNALKKAIQNGDSQRAQIYIRALGNFGHPKIVEIFEPYLTGKVRVSDFQRLSMVIAMNHLTKTDPKVARAAYWKLYQNVADTPEVRAAAVLHLLKANPSANMLQRMAESTKDEHNPHIRAIVKSAIESAAIQQSWDNWELESHAKAAKNMLNTTQMNAQLSQLHIKSNDVKDTPLSYQAVLATIGSQDSLAPQAVFVNLRQNLADLKLPYEGFSIVTSSFDDIIDAISNQFDASKVWTKKPSTPYKTSHGWSIQDVLAELNIVRDQAQPIEASMVFQTLAGKYLLTMNNQTVQQLPSTFQKAVDELHQGKNFNYTKMYNQYTVSMSFPTAMGFPFYYSLSTPTLLSVGGKARVVMLPHPNGEKISIPETLNATVDVHVVASSKVQAELGFINPTTYVRYTAGVDKDMQIHIPVHAQVDVDIRKNEKSQMVETRAKLQPFESENNFQIVTLRSKPYIAKQSMLQPAPLDQKVIHVRKPYQANFTLGQDLTGMAFRVDASTEDKFLDFATVYQHLKKHDVISALSYLTKEGSIHNRELTLSFNAEKSTAKAVELTAAIETLTTKTFDERDTYPKKSNRQEESLQMNVRPVHYSMQPLSEKESAEHVAETVKATLSEPSYNAAKPSDKSLNSQERRREFLRKLLLQSPRDFPDADAVVVDLSASFKGRSNAEFVATAAMAMSQVSDDAHAVLYLRKKSADNKEKQFAMATDAYIPRVPYTNFIAALKQQPDIFAKTAISFGEEIDSAASQIDVVALLRRTKSQREHVRHSPMGKLCVQQMHNGNTYMSACQNATITASKLNAYYLDIAYDRIPEQVQNATYKAYSLVRDFGWQFNSESVIGVNNQHKKIALKARFEPEFQAVNVSIAAPQFNSNFDNVRLNRWIAAAIVAQPNYSPARMLAHQALQNNYPSLCSVGQSTVNSFSNKTFPINLGKNWHAVLVSAHKQNSPSEMFHDLVVLTRETASSEHQKEVAILAGPNVIELTHARDFARVNVNGKTIKVSDRHTSSFSDDNGNTWAIVYGRPDGAVKIELPFQQVKMIYDRTNLAISSGSHLRDQTRGLCGKFNVEEASDFTVPRNCVVKEARDFAASYIIKPTGNAVDEKEQAKNAKCIPRKFDFGAQRHSEESSDEQYIAHSTGCISFKYKKMEHEGKTCFSKRAQLTCNSHCQPAGEMDKKVEFACVFDYTVAEQWQKQIKSGSIPSELSLAAPTKSVNMKIPQSCQP